MRPVVSKDSATNVRKLSRCWLISTSHLGIDTATNVLSNELDISTLVAHWQTGTRVGPWHMNARWNPSWTLAPELDIATRAGHWHPSWSLASESLSLTWTTCFWHPRLASENWHPSRTTLWHLAHVASENWHPSWTTLDIWHMWHPRFGIRAVQTACVDYRVVFKRKVNPIGFTKVDFGEPRFEPQELTLVNPIGFTFLKLVQIPNPEPIWRNFWSASMSVLQNANLGNNMTKSFFFSPPSAANYPKINVNLRNTNLKTSFFFAAFGGIVSYRYYCSFFLMT